MSKKKKYTIDGYHADNAQPFTIHAEGESVADAIKSGIARHNADNDSDPGNMMIVSVFRGHVLDKSGLDDVTLAAEFMEA